jgi:hypothetical protein
MPKPATIDEYIAAMAPELAAIAAIKCRTRPGA